MSEKILPSKTCKKCSSTFFKKSKESFFQFENRIYCNTKCSASVKISIPLSYETRKKLSIKKTGQKHSEETKEKCRKCILGKKQTKTHIKNAVEAKGHVYGGVDLRNLDKEEYKNYKYFKHINYTYKIDQKIYNEMLKKQNNCCAICYGNTKRKLSVDHCHITGKIRGLLCTRCNTSLGKSKDNIKLLKSMIKYLKKYENY